MGVVAAAAAVLRRCLTGGPAPPLTPGECGRELRIAGFAIGTASCSTFRPVARRRRSRFPRRCSPGSPATAASMCRRPIRRCRRPRSPASPAARYAQVAEAVIAPFLGGEIDPPELAPWSHAAYATLRPRGVAPLVQLGDNLFFLELFHGPTLAFKDVAMQLLGAHDGSRARRARPAPDHRRRDVGRHRRRGHRSVSQAATVSMSSSSIRTTASPTCSAGR